LRDPASHPPIKLIPQGFSFDNVDIFNPTLSSCGRFVVDPAVAYGFEVREIGDGSTALRLDVENGYVLLTDDHASHDIQIYPNEPFRMSLFTDDDELIEQVELKVGVPLDYEVSHR
jgi:hypothetical protein